MVVYDQGTGFVTREVGYVPGLFKIFDEILGEPIPPAASADHLSPGWRGDVQLCSL